MTVMTPGKALAELADAREAIATLTQQLTALKQQVEWYKRQMFGEKSEQFLDKDDEADQEPDMFAAAELDAGGTLNPSSDDDPQDLDDIPKDERELVSEREVCKLVTKRTTSHVVRYIIPC